MSAVVETDQLVFVLRSSGNHYWLERRYLRERDATHVLVSHPLMPGGEVFPAAAVFEDWPAAVAAYWSRQRGVLAGLRRQVKALERRIAAGKEPRFLKREQ